MLLSILNKTQSYFHEGAVVVVDRMVVGFTTTCATVPITTNAVSSNPTQAGCIRYNIM